MPRERIYTKAGDDGTTGLFYGGRVPKDSELPAAYGTVDEAQAVLGLARAAAGPGELSDLLVELMRDLYVLMAELATAPANRHKLTPGSSAVTSSIRCCGCSARRVSCTPNSTGFRPRKVLSIPDSLSRSPIRMPSFPTCRPARSAAPPAGNCALAAPKAATAPVAPMFRPRPSRPACDQRTTHKLGIRSARSLGHAQHRIR